MVNVSYELRLKATARTDSTNCPGLSLLCMLHLIALNELLSVNVVV